LLNLLYIASAIPIYIASAIFVYIGFALPGNHEWCKYIKLSSFVWDIERFLATKECKIMNVLKKVGIYLAG